MNEEQAVRERYSAGARERESSLCCPISYDPALLAAIPDEVIERDYGCGDPTRTLRPGETVLDMGSGGGKACFLAGQIVGPGGRVIGVDMNDDMLALARRAAPEVARRVGYANVEFVKARLQDLALDLEALDRYLADQPVRSGEDLVRLEAEMADRRRLHPLVRGGSIDVVVSNCVLNLVRPADKAAAFAEIHRVLRPGGRAVISDIVSSEDVPESLARDPELWSGCISGAFREDRFVEAFEAAGFHGITILERHAEPWRTIGDLEFRSVTVAAWKPDEASRSGAEQTVVYRGPFREVVDDEGRVLLRGVPTAVDGRALRTYASEPYRAHVALVSPGDSCCGGS